MVAGEIENLISWFSKVRRWNQSFFHWDLVDLVWFSSKDFSLLSSESFGMRSGFPFRPDLSPATSCR